MIMQSIGVETFREYDIAENLRDLLAEVDEAGRTARRKIPRDTDGTLVQLEKGE